MEIKTDSLYYSWLTSFIKEPSHSICVLFWQNVWAILLTITVSIIVTVVGGGLIFLALTTLIGAAAVLLSLGYFIDPLWEPLMLFYGGPLEGLILAGGIVTWLFGIIAGVIHILSIISPKIASFIGTQAELVRYKLESRESGFCPKVDYIDETKEKS